MFVISEETKLYQKKVRELLKNKRELSLLEKQIVIKISIRELETLIEENFKKFNPHIIQEVVGFYVHNDTSELGFSVSIVNKSSEVLYYDLDEPYVNMILFVKDVFIGDTYFDENIEVTMKDEEVHEYSDVEIVIG